MEQVKVLHIITRLIVGGAQENTLLTADLLDQSRWSVDVISGPQTGPEGSLWSFASERGISTEGSDHLVREIHPVKDLLAVIYLYRRIRRGGYAIVHTHSSKAGILGRIAARCARVPLIVHTVHGWSFHEHMSAARRLLVLSSLVTLASTTFGCVLKRTLQTNLAVAMAFVRPIPNHVVMLFLLLRLAGERANSSS